MFDWFNKKQEEELFKKEIPEEHFLSMFQRMDVDTFFNNLNNMWDPGELIQKIGGRHNLYKLYKNEEIYAAVDKRIAALLDTRLVLEGPSKDLVNRFSEQILPHERQLKQDFWWTVAYGYGVEQIIYNEDMSGDIVGFQKEDFWRFEPMKDLTHAKLIFSANPALANKVMPYGKWVLTTNNGTYSNPFGDPMFERLIQPWIFRCTGWDLWMDFAKRFANGFMHGRIVDEKKREAFRAALAKAGKSSILITDKNTEVNMIQASRDSSIYDMIDTKTVKSIQKVILGETLSSDMQERGSSGASGVHNDVRLEKTRADISLIEKAINETIDQIATVWGIETEELPRAKLIYDPGLNQELATRDTTLHGMGIRFSKQYYINNYGFKEEDFEIQEPAASPFGFSQKKKTFLKPEDVKKFIGMPEQVPHVCSSMNFAPNVSRKNNRQMDEKEDVVQYLARNGVPPIQFDLLMAAISLSKNEKELDENLAKLFDNSSTAFEDLLMNTLYYSSARGAMFANPERLPADEEV